MKVIEGKKKVTARQIQFLLKENPDKAWMMVMQVRKALDKSVNVFAEKDINNNPSVDVDEFDKHHKLQIGMAMEDLYNNALIRPAFKKYLLHDIPEQKLGEVFKNGKLPPKTIRLPSVLRSLLSPESLSRIDEYWNKHFAGKPYLHHSDKDLKPNFKP
jgi:hypothetical protein